MKKLAILISVLLFTLVSLFFFVSLKPSPIFAAPCSFAINDRNLTRNGTLVVGLQTGTVGKDYLVRLIVKNITINSPEWVLDNYDLKNVSGFPTAFAAKISDLGIISSDPLGYTHEFQITVKVIELNPWVPCTPTEGIIVSVGPSGVPGSDETQFTAPPEIVNYGITTLDLIKVINVPTFWEDADKTTIGSVKFRLSGQWDGCCEWLRERGGDDKWLAVFPTMEIKNICENGEANRPAGGEAPCEEKFKTGEYKIEMVKAHDENAVLASYKFKVELVLSEAGGDETTQLLPGQVNTPFGLIDATPEGLGKAFLSLGVGAAGGVAFLMMVFGAYRLIFAGGNPESIQEGRSVMTAAIAGLIVVILAIFLLDLIGISILGLVDIV